MICYPIILLLCILAGQGHAQGCNEVFKEDLLREFRNILNSELSSVNSKIQKMDVIESELAKVKGLVEEINMDMDGVTGRSSDSLTATQNVESMTQNIYNVVNDMADEIQTLDMKVESIEVNMLSNNTTGLLLNITNNTEPLKYYLEDLLTITTDTAGILINITEETESLKGSVKELANTTISIEDNLIESLKERFEEISNTTISIEKNFTESMKEKFEEIANITISIEGNIIELLKERTEGLNNLTLDLEKNISTAIIANTDNTGLIQNIKQQIKTQADKTIMKIQNLEQNFEIFKNETNNYFEIMNNKSIALENYTIQVENMTQDTNTETIGLSRKLNTTEYISRCTALGGFVMSNRCFKIFTDLSRSWAEAKAKCEEENLILAEPKESIAVRLRKHLMDNYVSRNFYAWLGAQGNGANLVWKSDRTAISNNSPLWHPSHKPISSKTSSSYCVMMAVHETELRYHPNQPYLAYTCSSKWYTLCQVASE